MKEIGWFTTKVELDGTHVMEMTKRCDQVLQLRKEERGKQNGLNAKV
jgi:hypothetical protein